MRKIFPKLSRLKSWILHVCSILNLQEITRGGVLYLGRSAICARIYIRLQDLSIVERKGFGLRPAEVVKKSQQIRRLPSKARGQEGILMISYTISLGKVGFPKIHLKNSSSFSFHSGKLTNMFSLNSELISRILNISTFFFKTLNVFTFLFLLSLFFQILHPFTEGEYGYQIIKKILEPYPQKPMQLLS